MLDVMLLPRVDGLDVCRILRREWDLAILLLTARFLNRIITIIGHHRIHDPNSNTAGGAGARPDQYGDRDSPTRFHCGHRRLQPR
ncbi:hypothetical protein AB0H34_43785 [Saccharopolyspora shandongensis]|uniref:hypothetical protein n=1 Tax=Saccharopolyspora shandongensis TaxID=418495 RepID=UPI003409EB8B